MAVPIQKFRMPVHHCSALLQVKPGPVSSTTSTFQSMTPATTAGTRNVDCRLVLADVYGNTLNALPQFATSASISITITHTEASNVAPTALQPRSFGTRMIPLVVDPARMQQLVLGSGADENATQVTTLAGNSASTITPLEFVSDGAGAPAVVAWSLSLGRSGQYSVSVQVGTLDVEGSPLVATVSEAAMHAQSFRVEGPQAQRQHSVVAGASMPVMVTPADQFFNMISASRVDPAALLPVRVVVVNWQQGLTETAYGDVSTLSDDTGSHSMPF